MNNFQNFGYNINTVILEGVSMDNEIKGMTILKIETDPINSTYTVTSHAGSSVNEIAFAVHVVIKTLIRDGHIKTKKEFDKLVNKYFNDSQYAEVKNV